VTDVRSRMSSRRTTSAQHAGASESSAAVVSAAPEGAEVPAPAAEAGASVGCGVVWPERRVVEPRRSGSGEVRRGTGVLAAAAQARTGIAKI